MKAIILAAGEGKRFLPLTENKPKCLIKLFGKSLIERQIETYRNCGISNISIVTGYKGDMINIPNVIYFKNTKYNKTNMVETLFCAREKLNDCVIVSYGDIIFEKAVLKKLIDSHHDLSVVVDLNWKKYWKLRFKTPSNDAESLQLDENGLIKDIGQKIKNIDEVQGQYIGLMKFQNDGLESLKRFYDDAQKKAFKGDTPLNSELPFEKSYMTDLLQAMIKQNFSIHSVPINGGWLELDSISDYELYCKKFENKTLVDLIHLEN